MEWQALGPWVALIGAVGAVLSAAAAWRSANTARDSVRQAADEARRQRVRELEVTYARARGLGDLAAETATSLRLETDALFSMRGMTNSGAYEEEKNRIDGRLSQLDEQRENVESIHRNVSPHASDEAVADAVTRFYKIIAAFEIHIQHSQFERSALQPQLQLEREIRSRPTPPIQAQAPRR